jgi:hypothetical protein
MLGWLRHEYSSGLLRRGSIAKLDKGTICSERYMVFKAMREYKE